MKFLISNFQKDTYTLTHHQKTNLFYTYDNDARFIVSDVLFFLKGYLIKDKKPLDYPISNQMQHELNNSWPLPDNFSGSYGYFFANSPRKMSIANDCIGLYPIYYYFKSEQFVVSNNLHLLQSFLKVDIDQVGLFQRKHAPENINLGSRTLLSDVKRLLPGEKIEFDLINFTSKSFFDNRLYNNIQDDAISFNFINQFWECIQTETKAATSLNNKAVHIALSGGMDSRMLLGAMPIQNSTAFTYGKKSDYEVKVAKDLAALKRIKFKSVFDKKNYFPAKDRLIETLYASGTPSVMNFYDILNEAPKEREVILLGDSCEALPARNIKKYASRKSRQKHFFTKHILNRPYHFKLANKNDFQKWCFKTIETYKKQLEKSAHFYQEKNYENYIEVSINDLKELLERIEEHNLKYVELYDELLTWYTHGRITISQQILLCDSSFYAISPTMGSDILIRTSNIHPNQRLNYRTINALFKRVKDLNKYNKIPTNQAPLLSRNAPAILQFLVWGLRSKIDQVLIKRLMKSKNPKQRYRLFDSLNWVDIYQQDDLEQRFETYFENNVLGDNFYTETINKVMSRKNLEAWPLMNMDLMAIAILNIEVYTLTKEVQIK